jgi:hypothetical protein
MGMIPAPLETLHPPRAVASARRRGWRPTVAAAVVLVVGAAAGAGSRAESLRCNGHFAEVGDSRASLLFKCGEPAVRDSFCAPVYRAGSTPPGQLPQPLPAPIAQALLPCIAVDEWLYERGPGNLMATVRLQSGVIQSIRYARSPR